MDLFFCGMLAFIFLDIAILKRRSPEAFHQTFSFSSLRMIVLIALFVPLLCLGFTERADLEIFFAVLSAYIFAIYIGCRIAYKGALHFCGEDHLRPRILLASEAMETFLIWFLWVLGGSVVLKNLGKVFLPLTNEMTETMAFSVYASTVMVALIYRLSRAQKVLTFLSLTGLRVKGQAFWKIWILPVFLGAGWAILCALIFLARPEEPVTPFGQMMESITSFNVFLAFLTGAVLLAPFFEEVIFRGFFFAVIDTVKGKAFAIPIVAILFGFMHVEQYWGDWAVIALVAALGLLLTLLRAWTGSSIPGILAHYTFNATMTLMPIILLLLSNPIYFQYQVQYFKLNPPAREAILEESIKKYPSHAASYNDLAWSYAEQNKNLDQALIWANKALELEPRNYMFWDTKAEVLFRQGKVREAVAIEALLVERYPGVPALRTQLEKFQRAVK